MGVFSGLVNIATVILEGTSSPLQLYGTDPNTHVRTIYSSFGLDLLPQQKNNSEHYSVG
jgi:hypothetical protein